MEEHDLPLDPYNYLGLVLNPNGSIQRLQTPVNYIQNDHSDLLIKDIPINESNKTWVRLILPKKPALTKLPLIVFFHGGGFVLFSVDSPLYNNIYAAVAPEIPAVIVSVGYRLAPEHRLPAAYDDCEEALKWIKNCPDEWLTKYADFSKVYLMGTSSGANIAYHIGLAAASYADDLKPLNIKGLVLIQPFFGGKKRKESELRLANNKVMPLSVTDLLWELALPVDADRDHVFCNFKGSISPKIFDQIRGFGWKVLVSGCDGDILIDYQIELVKILQENGVEVVSKFDAGGYHGYQISDPSKLEELCLVLKEFMQS
ncbi:hypothetical protein M9H77_00203 [Catharanthus roseus]|nr:hypothetical protein M9H77_00203 [Catharanthus roseus]